MLTWYFKAKSVFSNFEFDLLLEQGNPCITCTQIYKTQGFREAYMSDRHCIVCNQTHKTWILHNHQELGIPRITCVQAHETSISQNLPEVDTRCINYTKDTQ